MYCLLFLPVSLSIVNFSDDIWDNKLLVKIYNNIVHLLYRLLCLYGLLINFGGNDVFSGNEMILHPIINVIYTYKYATLHFTTNVDKMPR